MANFSIYNLGENIGRKLSDFRYVILTLAVYLTLCFLTLIWTVASYVPDYNQAQLITYAVSTGGDPFTFRSEIGDNRFLLWNWLLILHALSWLIVPVLAGTAVSAAFISWEKKKSHLQEEILNLMKIGIKNSTSNLADEEVEKRALQQLRELEKKF